jgi:hypothetical protein
MSQCLRCNQPCSSTVLFCDSCRLLLKQQNAALEDQKPVAFSSQEIGAAAYAQTHTDDDKSGVATMSPPVAPGTPPLPTESGNGALTVEQTLSRLNDAAQQIAAFDQDQHRHRVKISRLTRFLDISQEIQRYSTPMPRISGARRFLRARTHARARKEMQLSPSGDPADKIPDAWPWLDDDDDVDVHHDIWADRTDPLAVRKLPSGREGRRIDREDIRRAAREGYVVVPLAGRFVRVRMSFLRLAVTALIGLAVFGMLADGLLAFVAFFHPYQSNQSTGSPLITLSANKVDYGQTIVVHITHFSPSANVFLSRDMNEQVENDTNSSFIRMGQDGSRDVHIPIDKSWEPGSHLLEAEDMTTHYTASANLLVMSGSMASPQLVLSTTQLDFGADLQGTNTIDTVMMRNGGQGTIAWTASSDQPWLLMTPNQGTFSDTQMLVVGVQRANLKAGSYTGTVTLVPNVGTAQQIQVTMTVQPLSLAFVGTSQETQPTAMTVQSFSSMRGAMLSATPVVQSFVATDGGSSPAMQYLTISNPGNQALFWSLKSNTPYKFQDQGPTPGANWLNLDKTSGIVLPGSSVLVGVHVNSTDLLPGLYINSLQFSAISGHTTIDRPQNVAISLTVQPHCGVLLNTGSMSFTAVNGQGNPGNQTLTLTTTSGCTSALNWQASSSDKWVVLQTTKGVLHSGIETNVAVGVNTNGLKPGAYSAVISFVAGQTTQSELVQLTVQSTPPPGAPIMAVSPLDLNFSTMQGQADPPGQTVTITNTGKSALSWQNAAAMQIQPWLHFSPASGTVLPGQSAQVTVSVSAGNLTLGRYNGQIVLNGTDAQGGMAGDSPQAILINLVVQAPCTLSQLPTNTLTFSNILQGTATVTPQSVTIFAAGNCSWPVNWSAQVVGSGASWLTLGSSSGAFTGSGQFGTFLVTPSVAGLAPGLYTTTVAVTAKDASGAMVQGSGQSFGVSVNIVQPCSLQVSSSPLALSVTQAQSNVATQTLAINQVGNCSQSLDWTVVTPAAATWLSAAPTSGTGSGTVTVTADAAALTAGSSYQAAITINSIDPTDPLSPAAPVATVPLTLTVQ